MCFTCGAYQVYPRVYGATLPEPGPARTSTGLSPRVRGNLTFLLAPVGALGSIPACTGQPAGARLKGADLTVYPRVYGATQPLQESRLNIIGLSPRVRGNQAAIPPLLRMSRSIPACTGQP